MKLINFFILKIYAWMSSAINTFHSDCSLLLEMSFKHSRSWRQIHNRDSFFLNVKYFLEIRKLIGVMHFRPFILTSYFFGDQLFRFDMRKRIERFQVTFAIPTSHLSNIIIWESISDIVVFCFCFLGDV